MSICPNPPVKYFLSDQDQLIKPDSELWNVPLPSNRNNAEIKSCRDKSHSITYGDYFEAAGDFIRQNNYEFILNALSFSKQKICLERINEIRILLEKHGRFYHPAKVVVVTDSSKTPFVLNVAISEAGIECAGNEYITLQRLHKKIPNDFIPSVYGFDSLVSKRNNLPISMFLARWFEGYNEFHISKDPKDGENKIIIWDHVKGNQFISKDYAAEIYRQAAMIMTFFYDIYTFEQIFPWHHAAGDFVVKITDNKPDVKLITVRQYAALYSTDNNTNSMAADPDLIFEGLLMFIIVLSIRMRLDRLDGTGDIVWADKEAAEGTIKGFMDGIFLKSKSNMIPFDFNHKLMDYLLSYSEVQLFELLKIITNSFNQSAPDIKIISSNLSVHSGELYHAISKL
ncbi:hypothetical protein [Desulfobacterium sp. N47]|uniref:Uncharacterized protein n=1 Tax=uncultured Desulfobacterium sp. TaxID=201089 RepID=E1YFB3_9BACT|nr:hypothetical protein N47_J02380 [uncultured Desulfobacterium sp.]